MPSDTYIHDVYSSKGYRVNPPIEQQRQIGLEIGMNLEQILNDLRVMRSTWWATTCGSPTPRSGCATT